MAQPKPTIYIVSGGIGASAEQLVHTALAQFPENTVEINTTGNVREPEQIAEVLKQVRQTGGLVVYTLVDPHLQAELTRQAAALDVAAADLMGPLIAWATEKTGHPPKAQPGLYRQLRRQYFDRVAAIDFTLTHDDGTNREGWPQAEVMLVGVSRVGKTPLSIYMAVLGMRVANYPFVPQVTIPESLFSLDPRRVIGLTIEPGQLIQYRQARQRQLGVSGASAYVDPKAVYEEVEEALKVFRRSRFAIIDMTDKTIEQGADEIIRLLAQVGG
jgi:regulator of PEP synthase PpsR (kinase-PPPase family)